MITLLLPTRGRFEHVSKTINSFFEMAKNKNNIQLILRCDNDDFDFLSKIKELPHLDSIQIIIGSRYGGYLDLHLFYNEMLKLAVGNFIIPINDDLICNTLNYDELILSKPIDDIKIYTGRNNGNFQGWYFPIINKRILDELGYLSRCVFYDGYLYFSLVDLGIYEEIDFSCTHYVLKDKLSEDRDVVLNNVNSGSIKHLDNFKFFMEEDRVKIKRLLNDKSNN